MGCGATTERQDTQDIHARARDRSLARPTPHEKPLSTVATHAVSSSGRESQNLQKTLALLPPACAVMGSSAGSSAAQKSHASERLQSSTAAAAARIGILKSTIASKRAEHATHLGY